MNPLEPWERLQIDRVYAEIAPEQVGLYQAHLESILGAVDVDNLTKSVREQSHNGNVLDADTSITTSLMKEALNDGLNRKLVQIMVYQFFLADVIPREIDRIRWVFTVMHRHDEDYFPDPATVIKTYLADRVVGNVAAFE